MSLDNYEVGTVAMATHNGKRMRVVAQGGSRWVTPCCWSSTKVTDVTPLVCIEATREDADDFEEALRSDSGMPGAFRLSAVVEAIREQIPEPAPPKRWTALGIWLRWNGNPVASFDEPEVAQQAADALNAAESA